MRINIVQMNINLNKIINRLETIIEPRRFDLLREKAIERSMHLITVQVIRT